MMAGVQFSSTETATCRRQYEIHQHGVGPGQVGSPDSAMPTEDVHITIDSV